MNIHQLLKAYKDIEIDLLLSDTLRQPKEFLYLNPTFKLTIKQLNNLTRLIARRRAGEPIAYLVGYKYFYDLKFKVNKQVLIPRPETEWLVDKALEMLNAKCKIQNKKASLKFSIQHSAFSILDIGTGSGCVAVSVAKELQSSNCKFQIVGSDISDKALKVARANAKMHKVDVTFVQSDLFKNIRGKFDIITANLPYVPQGMYELLYNNLKYEPRIAITDGSEVWEIYEKFFKALPKHLKPNGVALLEIDDGSKPDLQKMLKKLLPHWQVTFIRDLGGLWRYLDVRPPLL